jgi:branched-chain amino acid transport system permease protein
MAMVVVILAAPEGLFWKGQEFARRHWPALFTSRSKSTSDDRTDMASANMMAEPSPANQPYDEVGKVILSVRGLSHSFGGLKAVQNVSFDVSEGTILGIIGPNGAGKTTVFNLLNGFLRPDAGEILLHGRSVVGWKPHEMCNAGVGRTFQIMRPFSRLSVIENVVIGSFVHARDERTPDGWRKRSTKSVSPHRRQSGKRVDHQAIANDGAGPRSCRTSSSSAA